MSDERRDELAGGIEEPKVKVLAEEFDRAKAAFPTDKLDAAEEVRMAYWENQAQDGKKHDTTEKEAFPWDGASDTRVRLADEVIRERTDLLEAAFGGAAFYAAGIEPSDANLAGSVAKALDWARNGGIAGIEDEARLLSEYALTSGWSALQVTWDRRLARSRRTVTMAELADVRAGELPPGSPLLEIPLAVADPTREEEAAELLRLVYPAWVQSLSPSVLAEEVPDLGLPRLRKAVRELRQRGETSVPVPYVVRNNPSVAALAPYEELLFPPETTDIQRARVVFRIDGMTEAELRAKVATDGWDEGWVEQVLKTEPSETAWARRRREAAQAAGAYSTEELPRTVVWAYRRAVDEDGVECVTCTVFCPEVTNTPGGDELYGWHGELGYAHGEYPFVVYRNELRRRAVTESRGVPEVVEPWQREVKVQRDGIVDRTSLSILPPLLVPQRNLGKRYKLGPAKEIPTTRPDEVSWMQVPPGNIAEAIEVMREVKLDVAQYYGRRVDGVDPMVAQTRMQNGANRFLRCWVGAFRQVLSLMRQYLSAVEWQRITGSPVPPQGAEEIARVFDWRLVADMRDHDPDWMAGKLKALAQFVLPLDAAGVIDRAKLARVMASWIDPTLARAVVADTAGASLALQRRVREQIAQMFLGNKPEWVENDPTAAAQLQFAQQVVQGNPKYQEGMMKDQRFAELMQEWGQNLQHSVDQEKNKMIGRLGVEG